MRFRSQLFRLIVFFLVLTIGNSFRDNDNLRNSGRNTHHDHLPADGPFKGAWTLKENGGEQVVVFIDNYLPILHIQLPLKSLCLPRAGSTASTERK